jgi:tetratricopeptide (TPR) repeat protein
MKFETPSDQRKFAHVSEEMGYLYDKLVYWLYQRQDVPRARTFADRLASVLRSSGPEMETIFAEECRSLVYEAKGNLAKAIEHRENEIRLIRRLHQLELHRATAHFVLSQYSYVDLGDRLDLLAVLYHGRGNLEKAISTLQESKELCEKNNVKFDGQDLLRSIWRRNARE